MLDLEKQFDLIREKNMRLLDLKYGKMLATRQEKLNKKRLRETNRKRRNWEIKKKFAIKKQKEEEKIKRNKKINEEIAGGITRKKKLRNTEATLPSKLPQKINWKKKALKEIQLFAKLLRARNHEKKIIVWVYDKNCFEILDRRVNAWHCFGQHNHPQLAFDIDNIRPITSNMNRSQWDQDWNRIYNLPDDIQNYLRDKAKDKSEKRISYTDTDYIYFLEKYRRLNVEECKRLWIIHPYMKK